MNTATDVRCLQCGATMIQEAVDHSPDYQRAAGMVDARIYGGIGAMLGFLFIGGLLKFVFEDLWLSNSAIVGFSSAGAALGAFLGRVFLDSKRNL